MHTLIQPTCTGRPPRSYRGRVIARCVAARTRALLRAVSLPCSCRIAGCVATNPSSQASAFLSRYNRLYRDALPSGQASLSCHDTIVCIATLTPSQAPRARAACRVVASLGRVTALPWLYRGRSWPCRGPCCCT